MSNLDAKVAELEHLGLPLRRPAASFCTAAAPLLALNSFGHQYTCPRLSIP
jgi:hypothetical protein